MQAFADGKPIECISRSGTLATWRSIAEPTWDWFYHEYRIAKTKKKYWVYVGAENSEKPNRYCGSLWKEKPNDYTEWPKGTWHQIEIEE